MFVMCGYDFCRDKNSLNPSPININQFTTSTLRNGIFDHWYVTKNVTSPYSSEIPTEWDYLTIMNANFEGNIDAGNITTGLSNIDGFKIKRRKITDYNWITLKFIPIEDLDIEDLSFVFNDNLASSLTEYEYAIVPTVGGIEGNYITNTINTKFNGVFVCDLDTIYKFYADVSYGTQNRVQKIGVFEPYGRQYPVVVSNGLINYNKGSFKGTILPNEYFQTKALDRISMVKEKDALLNFLTNKKAKILKDWNGNEWLMVIASDPTISYENDYGMGIASVNADWIEIGDYNKQSDLYDNGVIEEIE